MSKQCLATHLRGLGAKTGIELKIPDVPVGRRHCDGSQQRECQDGRLGAGPGPAHHLDVAPQHLQLLVHLHMRDTPNGSNAHRTQTRACTVFHALQ